MITSSTPMDFYNSINRIKIPIIKNFKCIIIFLCNFFYLICLPSFTNDLKAAYVKDLMNRRIELPEKIENIIAIGPGSLRLLAYMDTFKFIRGVEALEKDKSMIYKRPYALANFDYIKKLPTIGNGGPAVLPNFEKIVSLECDIIFATSYSLNQIKLIQKKTNIPVVSLNYGNTNDIINKEIKKSLKLIGLILDRENRAKI